MTKMTGYTYGSMELEKSPVSMDELALLKATLLWSAEDDEHLRKAGEILKPQTDQILDLWYGFVGSHPHLVHYFAHNGQPNAEYLAAVRLRFGQWIMDICQKPQDQDWLNYQHEIAKRHHLKGKNKTDGVEAAPLVHFRYMVAFIFPITATIRGFLGASGASAEAVDQMYHAWFKAITLTAILWCEPYIQEGQF